MKDAGVFIGVFIGLFSTFSICIYNAAVEYGCCGARTTYTQTPGPRVGYS